jgi:leucyl-tRNA synthetase
VNSGKYDGLDFQAAVDAIAADLEAKGLGAKRVQFRLRDWGISRQRYWGCPIPMIHCATAATCRCRTTSCRWCCPRLRAGRPRQSAGQAPRSRLQLPEVRQAGPRETDTMDTFVDSSWYFLRYACADSKDAMVDARANYWLPVDQYIGGIEHAILHLLYSRFWTRRCATAAWSGRRALQRLLTQGMVLAETYFRKPATAARSSTSTRPTWSSSVTSAAASAPR